MHPTTSRNDNPFHAGEQAVHERLGIRERMVDVGQRVIRTVMPEQHQRFYEQLPFMLAGSVDAAGRTWASMLVGRPGFVQAPHEKRLNFKVRPIQGDPITEGLTIGAQLGFLGIELHTRRRNRVNGHVVAVDKDGFGIEVDQSVGNCPQYIQGREFQWIREAGDLMPRSIEPLNRLDADARAFVERADTLFIATQAPAIDGAPDKQTGRGADVSHRGGRPGFVKVEDERTFLVPDFTGNFFFMTFGNLELNPRAGVLFVDFETGDLITLTGTAEVVWDGDALKAFDGAERAWRFRIDAGWRLREALPLRWAFRELSPHSAITGTWAEAEAKREVHRLAQTWRPYRVTRIVEESSVIRSFYLAPTDGRAVPPFLAGQHLPIRIKTAAGEELHRVYTISQAPSDDGLRLSIKREGLASSHLHDHVHEGGLIEAMGPRGQFTIDDKLRRPAVLIGAGVGITPMVAFARHVVTEGFRNRRTRPLHVIQVARDAALRAFGDELQALAQRSNGAMKLLVVLDSDADAQPGAHPGPLTIDLLKTLLPFDDHEFFLCGPPGFMQALYDGLRDLGVRDERIQAEAFGPSSLKRRLDSATALPPPPSPAAKQATVRFTRTGDTAEWTPDRGTLLEFAEGKGLSAPFSCRAGHCGSCATRLTAGTVTYAEPTAWRPPEGEVLLCCAVPAAGSGRIDLDL
ncbi:pyridoxamine 5'-phosphate oxidase family protein [Rhodoferax sp. AJA081-3]|uniref:pyridoxamine 5'-phosphate oxidase family protein n=1 Tax=Rhodoferax sp. AJA081-3 TaxID=2752316 RepID=UPI001ADEC1D1|nr:pyridoxamine 5'-phosphate oxidase family protein [Rhodoferax sp. AJA081-3]QTN27857.1 pyridoxamine 5'-phosphate oxidase family protein [Rhodoferax sp. AJA081-3]